MDRRRPRSPRWAAMLDPGSREPAATRFRQLSYLIIAVAAADAAILTTPAADRYLGLLYGLAAAAWGFWLVDWLLRLGVAPRYALSPFGILDALPVVALPVAIANGAGRPAVAALVMLGLLKAVRYLPGLGLLARVCRNERRSLLGVSALFVVVLLGVATAQYLLEREAQPEIFGTVPSALWWAIVTLTTTGYGDYVPKSWFGQVVAGATMIGGIIVLALLVGVLASGFVTELRRRDFLTAWNMVARVPFLRELGAATIAEVARLLRPQEVRAGAVVMRRGEVGDSMYFIVAGRVEVQLGPQRIQLGEGDFVGEIALVTGEPRTATVVALERTDLLALDLADFRELAGKQPELTQAIEREAARRLGALPIVVAEPASSLPTTSR